MNIDPQYRPYFYLPHPIPCPDRLLLHELEVELSKVTKCDFFTGDPITVTIVEYAFSDRSMKPFPPFIRVWEQEVSPGLSYVYDHGLTFGSEYSPSNSHAYSNPQLPDAIQHRFDARFAEVKTCDPEKYAILSQ